VKVLKRKVLKLGLSEETLWKLVAIQGEMGAGTLAETVTRLADDRHPEPPASKDRV
jgi:hypothetical protein